MPASPQRRYRKRKRAESEQETRQRITEAAVELHGTVGPANSTVTDIAKRAGVSRMTVYNHFPTDADLFGACSAHWAARNPFPDPSSWTIADPSERLAAALDELYAWYRAKEGMLGNVLRDVALVPALAEVMGPFWGAYMDGVLDALAAGWPSGPEHADALRSVLRLGVDFESWRLLTASGMSDAAAAAWMARMVSCAFA